MTHANTTSSSMYGTMVSNWSRSGTRGSFHVAVPVNTTAKVYIPAGKVGDVTEGGTPAAESDGVTFVAQGNGRVVFAVESGAYDFASRSVPAPGER